MDDHTSNNSDLTEQQLAHIDAFDARTEVPESIDFGHYDAKRFGPWNPYWFVYDFVRKRPDIENQKLLSVGCGNGRDALIYARMGYRVYGFDISPRAVEIATSLAKTYGFEDRTMFSVQPAEKLCFDDEYFDIAVGVNVLHHVDIDESIHQISRVLRPGGCAIFKEPLITPLRDKFRNTSLVTFFLPKGMKNLRKGTKFDLVPGEKNLDETALAIVRQHFDRVSIHRWRLLALLSAFGVDRTFLEKCDWRLFKVLPFVRRFGDQAVLICEKKV